MVFHSDLFLLVWTFFKGYFKGKLLSIIICCWSLNMKHIKFICFFNWLSNPSDSQFLQAKAKLTIRWLGAIFQSPMILWTPRSRVTVFLAVIAFYLRHGITVPGLCSSFRGFPGVGGSRAGWITGFFFVFGYALWTDAYESVFFIAVLKSENSCSFIKRWG